MEATHLVREYSFGPYAMSTREGVLRYRGEPVVLAAKAVDLLFVLLSERGRVVSKSELMDRIWPAAFVDEANLTQNIYLLRKLFKQHQSGVRIDNLPKQGYRLVVPDRSQANPPQFRYPAIAVVCTVLCIALLAGLATHSRQNATSTALEGNALREYMLARAYQDAGMPANLERSIPLFRSVMAAEPASALGYAGLAVSDASLAYYAPNQTRRLNLQADALSLAREAVRRDPGSADAFAALGGAEFSIEHNARAAGLHLQRAIALNPHQLNALVWYGTLLLNEGRVAQARRLLTRAVGIAPNSSGTVASLAWSDFIAADYVGAIELSRQQLLAQNQPVLAHITLGNAYLRAGDYRRAGEIVGLLLRDHRTRIQGVALSAQLHAALGQFTQAGGELRVLGTTADPRTIDSWDAASIAAGYLAVGDRPRAFIWLARVQPWERGEIFRDPRFSTFANDRAFAAWANG